MTTKSDIRAMGLDDHGPCSLLIIDDEVEIVKSLRRLFRRDYRVHIAESADQAYELMQEHTVHVIISDQRMPGMTGSEFYSKVRAEFPDATRLLLTGYADVNAVIQAINDGNIFRYITKPWNPAELKTIVTEAWERYKLIADRRRLTSGLKEANAELEQRVRERTAELAESRQQAQALLDVVLPPQVADRLKHEKSPLADPYEEVGVLFADLVAFSTWSGEMSASTLVRFLDGLFGHFDALCEQAGLQKIRNIGDGYMVASGIPRPSPTHLADLVRLGLEMQAHAASVTRPDGEALGMRLGIHAGPAVAGVIGQSTLQYDVWGATVNLASRVEGAGIPGRVAVSDQVMERLGESFQFEQGPDANMKGFGMRPTWCVVATPTVPLGD